MNKSHFPSATNKKAVLTTGWEVRTKENGHGCNLGITAGGCGFVLPDQKGRGESVVPDGNFSR